MRRGLLQRIGRGAGAANRRFASAGTANLLAVWAPSPPIRRTLDAAASHPVALLRPAIVIGLAIIGLVLTQGLLAGQPAGPSPVSGRDDNPALARFGRSVVFYVSFDGHENAEITAADPKPAGNAQWQAAAKRPDSLYAPGLFGKALRSGMHQLTYTCPKPVIGTTGSMALWIKPELLHHRGTYCWPAILDALDGGYRVMFGRIGDPANGEALYAHLSRGNVGVSSVQQTMADWKPGRWRLFAVTWDRAGVELSVDGAQPTRTSLKSPIERDAVGGLRVYLPGQNEDVFLYDEFLVLDVPLNHEEIRWLYEQGATQTK